MGKLLYALLFVVVLPAALIAWVRAASPAVSLPTPHAPTLGFVLAALGLIAMLEAMRELLIIGGGLPMNAYPPPRPVATGIYALIPHPIYAGFCTICIGLSLAFHSSAGLWLITPTVILGCTALVVGYEAPRLRARFGTALPTPLLRPPDPGESPPSLRDRLVTIPLLFFPWLILYEGWGHAQATSLPPLLLPGESAWPVLPWTTFAYSAAYPFVLALPFAIRTRTSLRRFFIAGLTAIIVVMLLYITLPLRVPPRPFDPHAWGSFLLELEHADNLRGAVAFPSFHVVWAILAAHAYATISNRARIISATLTSLICISCITTGMHAVADVLLAIPLAFLFWRAPELWSRWITACEHIANSWTCIRLGPLRIINYAAYAALASALGLFLSSSLAGPAHTPALAAIAIVALICAALWGQLLVGSKTLLRPFGYFGSLLGAAASLLLLTLIQGTSTFWLLAAALATSAPWIVLIGRFRCLVQGCCHGSPITGAPGLRYRHPHSRVCRIAALTNIPLHPTPAYSMLASLITGVLLARLWFSHAPLSMITGCYLLLAGLSRFLEESRRGEPQTQIVLGLRIYQWLAIASTIAGACITAIPSPASPATFAPSINSLPLLLVVAALYAFAMGADFPDSTRRFSRLT